MGHLFCASNHDAADLRSRVIDFASTVARGYNESRIPTIRRLHAERIQIARNFARACGVSTVVVSKKYRDISALRRAVRF